jgi:hypothetical protein
MWMAYASSTFMKKGENGGTSPTIKNGRKMRTSLKPHMLGWVVPSWREVPGDTSPFAWSTAVGVLPPCQLRDSPKMVSL